MVPIEAEEEEADQAIADREEAELEEVTIRGQPIGVVGTLSSLI